MSHQDTDRLNASTPRHQDLARVLNALLEPVRWKALAFRPDCTWTPLALAAAALLWAWSDESTLVDRFVQARHLVAGLTTRRRPPATTYQAFLKMLRRWTGVLTLRLIDAFRLRMRTDLAARFLIHGFCLFAVDGSRLGLPRTQSHEQRFSPASVRRTTRSKGSKRRRRRAPSRTRRDPRGRAKKSNNPQMWLTTLYHLGTNLPWDWRTGPSDSSERDHFVQMIDTLPNSALVTADAGFAGYHVWRTLIASGRHLLIRVGSNVRLLKKLGVYQETRGRVYLWPDREAARNQPPLVLRLVVAHGGRHPVYLVTSVLEEAALSDQQVVEIYGLRWGVELFYRHFKQTFQRRKLRSHTADHAELEATWSLLGLWAMTLHMEMECACERIPARQLSVARMLRAYRRSMRGDREGPYVGATRHEQLVQAVIDPYKRSHKASRDYPCQKPIRVIGPPQIQNATQVQIKKARDLRDQNVLGLTA